MKTKINFKAPKAPIAIPSSGAANKAKKDDEEMEEDEKPREESF